VEHRDATGFWFLAGLARPAHQYGNDSDVTRRGSLDLQAHEVIGVTNPTFPRRVGGRKPPITDQRQQHITAADRVGNYLGEIVSRLDGVDILEDLGDPEALGEPIVKPAGRVGGILPPVTRDHLIRELGSWGLDSDAACDVIDTTLTRLAAAYPQAAQAIPAVAPAIVEACQARTRNLLQQR